MPLTPKESSTCATHRSPSVGVATSQNDHTLQVDTTDQLLHQLLSRFSESDAKFTSFYESQRQTNNELSDKLTCLSQITETVALNTQRIALLEQENANLKKEIRDLKFSSQSAVSPLSELNEIIISGLPNDTRVSPSEVSSRVLQTLNIPELATHILFIRTMRNKQVPFIKPIASTSPSNSSPLPHASQSSSLSSSSSSIVLIMTSSALCNAVLDRKRAKRDLKQGEIFSNNFSRNLFVNPLLPRYLYDLLRQTKALALTKSYKYVWYRNGSIYVRKDNGLPVINITSPDDLSKLE